MKVSETVRRYFQEDGRMNLLATSDGRGRVDLAAFGSLYMKDDSSLQVMLGDNRSFVNLKDNPAAACMVTINGTTGLQTQGCRLYLKVSSIEDAGTQWEEARERIRERIGPAADMLKHLVSFEIVEARPIFDFGQGI